MKGRFEQQDKKTFFWLPIAAASAPAAAWPTGQSAGVQRGACPSGGRCKRAKPSCPPEAKSPTHLYQVMVNPELE